MREQFTQIALPLPSFRAPGLPKPTSHTLLDYLLFVEPFIHRWVILPLPSNNAILSVQNQLSKLLHGHNSVLSANVSQHSADHNQ